ncbi:MAG: RHH-type transcriptional regulator, rel operon repressor / antitoxin RelB [Actinomycetota bacterium]|nr:RHH-type transcriptional regulator, rel operon repressor / antitoxin RelB [Actinomycetota bacterium]
MCTLASVANVHRQRYYNVYMSYTRMGETLTITIRLTKDEEDRLNALAERTGRTKSFYVRTAVRTYLEDLEDAYAADEAIREFEASGRKSVPLSEAIADLGLTRDELARAGDEMHSSGDL